MTEMTCPWALEVCVGSLNRDSRFVKTDNAKFFDFIVVF